MASAEKVVITGGAGFIGSHLAAMWAAEGAEVVVVDNLRTGRLENLDGVPHTYFNADITRKETLADAFRGARIVHHLAAMVNVPESFEDPVECERLNTLGTMTVLEAACEAGAECLVFSSSCSVYPGGTEAQREDNLPEPASPYAITKLSGEYYCELFRRQGWLNTACLRYFNVFGPRQDPNSQYAAAVPIFITKALREETLTVFGDGEQTRDFVFVRDVVGANAHFAETPDLCGVYNVAYGGRRTVNDLARRILRLTGSKSTVVHAPERPGDVRHSCASVERLSKTGFQVTADFDSGLDQTIRAFRDEGR
jgi:UDP-glucose 4-epimerase